MSAVRKGTFTGTCECCQKEGAGLAVVYFRDGSSSAYDGSKPRFLSSPTTLCPGCRARRRGQYKLDQRHK